MDNIQPHPTHWQPITTAPQDNARALYLARFDQRGKLVELDFNGGWEYWQESWELPDINGYSWVSHNGIENPTHWAYQDEPIPLTGVGAVPIPVDQVEATIQSLGSFCSDQGWADTDMQIMDYLIALVAQHTKKDVK